MSSWTQTYINLTHNGKQTNMIKWKEVEEIPINENFNKIFQIYKIIQEKMEKTRENGQKNSLKLKKKRC